MSAPRVDPVGTPLRAEEPLVSVVILTFGREAELRRTMDSVLGQDYANIEVIVVDNAVGRKDGAVREVLHGVVHISLEENLGCGGRNKGVEAARGEYVVTLDNDVALKDRGALRSVIRFFEDHPGAACVNFKVLGRDGSLSLRDWCHPRAHGGWCGREFPTDHIAEGASAFRREAFRECGGYFDLLFIGHEGKDLAVRILKKGYDIYYSPTIEAVHYASPGERPEGRAYYFNTRNAIWLYYLHYPWPRALGLSLFYTGMTFIYALRHGQLGSFSRGLADGLKGLPKLRREAMDRPTARRLAALRALRPGLFRRLCKHLCAGERYR